MSTMAKFRKPLDYNPDLAQKTLANVHMNDSLQKSQQSKSLCMQLGLDDVMDIEDSEEDESNEDTFCDLFVDIGVLAEERESSVAIQGLYKHIKKLCARCNHAADSQRQPPILHSAELTQLLVEVSYELQQLLQQLQADAISVENTAQKDHDLRKARSDLRELQDVLRQKDHTIASLESKLALVDSSGSLGDAFPASLKSLSDMKALHSRIEELQMAVSIKDQYIWEQAKEIKELRDSIQASAATTNSSATKASSIPPAKLLAALQHMQSELVQLRRCKEMVMQEVLALQKEMFSPQPMKLMARHVRDREINQLKKAKASSLEEIARLQSENNELREEAERNSKRLEQQLHIAKLEADGRVAHYQSRWKEEFDRRRKLHNTVMELKGNIRVLCRVRPMLNREGDASQETPLSVVDVETLRVRSDKGERDFEFDRVFAPSDGQDAVYEEVEGLVVSSLDGFNISIMAYGQTGSGKTYTMTGAADKPGVNTRALSNLFKVAAQRSADLEYSFKASILEIYNEQIFDLLVPGSKDQGDKLDVKEGPEGMQVAGLTLAQVSNMDDVTSLLNTATQNRTTFATNMNEHSSRSHLVLSVYLTGRNKQTGVMLRGKLHLIDLAGSERLSRTGAQGDRLKEAQNINKSLSALGDVVQALQQKTPHVPYRNSKLTRLLEDSLGGSSKCVLVVNCSPSADSVCETKCSLEFASRARKVELGKAKANTALDALSSPGKNGSPRLKAVSDSGSVKSPDAAAASWSRIKSPAQRN